MNSPSFKPNTRRKARGEHLPRDNQRLYEVWKGMKSRCNNPHNTCYYLYGGKGISVCKEWEKFKPFYEWAIANGYDENAKLGGCTLDRIDSSGNYEPSNCRWANATEQSRNRSCVKALTLNGKTQIASEWARELNIPLPTISTRLKRGWGVERALSQNRWIRSDSQSRSK